MQVCKYYETKLPDLVTRIQDRIEKDCKKASKYTHYSIINPRRACAAKVTVVVLCVCVSTTILALQATRRYQQLQCYKGKKNNVAILLKRLRSKTSEKSNMHNEHWLTSTAFSPFSAPWTN